MGRYKGKKLLLTAVSIKKGIIILLEKDGVVGYYRQRGLNNLDPSDEERLIENGELKPDWRNYKELPRGYKISFENERIDGRASPRFKFE